MRLYIKIYIHYELYELSYKNFLYDYIIINSFWIN